MRKALKLFFLAIVALFHLVLFATVNFVTPSYEITKVTGVEVKRVDKDGPITKANPADGPTRDVYFINTQNENGKIMVYRNEDTRWGFPFYFKFGSANLQAEAQALGNEGKNVQIKYYGWRLIMFDEFRNALSVKEVMQAESESMPILAYILYFLLVISLFISVQFIRGWFDSEK